MSYIEYKNNTAHGSTPYTTYQVKFTHMMSYNVGSTANIDECFYVNETWLLPNHINIVDYINERYNVIGGISYVITNNMGMF